MGDVPIRIALADRVGWIDRDGRRHGKAPMLLGRGFGALHGRLMTLMGPTATASMGVVVAHHQAPLSRVLRELREAEGRAKREGRNRFCIRVLKRGGGEVGFTSPWWPTPEQASRRDPCVEHGSVPVLREVQKALAETDLSRSALYRAQLWLDALTDPLAAARAPVWRALASGSIAAQFERGGLSCDRSSRVASRLVDFVCEVTPPASGDAGFRPRSALENLLAVAEFLARESRHRGPRGQEEAA